MSGVLQLTPDQLVRLTPRELSKMSRDNVLQMLHQLGYSIEGIETKTAALTKLSSAITEIEPGEESPE
jgi:hypothetical protein